ncbi:head-tail connector protein [Stenotrophomonas sp. 24(2023)]|uniref:head-tail connector protein n=1 Tax=Stenotrophomonas sp. 24(2023) TaxID=3068324 RepID=UPI0027DFF7BC|nr:head-tail connector protein [Stenotrophomonas sp. 24(2023)]WMJ71308.1 head-tail connector protein [Stenotrophomonas sp. 24(2023)]
MPLLTLEQCRVHCRIDGDYDDAILGDLLAAATDAASAYLGRSLFDDQTALDQALDQFPQDMAAAVAGHDAAVAAATAEGNAAKAKAMRDVADRRLAVATARGARLLQGLPANDSIRAAVRLLLGHLYAHREAVVVSVHALPPSAGTAAIAVELPFGAAALLDPYRLAGTP